MNKRALRIVALVSMLTLLILSACGKKDIEYLSILTGGTQGTYYALGGAMAENISEDTGIKTTAEVSQASAANMTALKDGNAELAFVQTDIAYYASKGEMMFDGEIIDTVSAIGFLYPETVQLVTTEKSGIRSFADLQGKKVSVGAPGSGTYANAEQLLEIHGLTMDDIQAQDLDFGESTESLQAGQIDAAFITGGTPTAAVEALNATNQVFIVPVEDAKADELIAKYQYYAKEVISAGTYGIANDTPTVSVGAMLVIQNDISEDVAYKITKSIYDNASKLTHPKAALIKAETGLDGVGIPVHPGAQKYFDEQK